jgi:hypothetical protein
MGGCKRMENVWKAEYQWEIYWWHEDFVKMIQVK